MAAPSASSGSFLLLHAERKLAARTATLAALERGSTRNQPESGNSASSKASRSRRSRRESTSGGTWRHGTRSPGASGKSEWRLAGLLVLCQGQRPSTHDWSAVTHGVKV